VAEDVRIAFPAPAHMTPAQLAEAPRLVGRDQALADVLAVATPITLVTGPAGIGRSALLAAVRAELLRRDVAVVEIRLTPAEHTQPRAGLLRLGNELLGLGRRWLPDRPVDTRPVLAKAQLSGLLSALAGVGRPLAVLIDDAHWLDPQSLDAMLAGMGALAGTSIRVVCAWRTPTTLTAPAAVSEVRLRPLNRADTTLLLTRSLQAMPAADLRAGVHRDCRGVPALILAAVAGHRASGALHVIDQHAYLVPADQPPVLPPDSPVLRRLQRDDPLVWEISKALAVFHPLGDVAVGLIAEAIAADEQQVLAVLSALREEGLVLAGPWHFRAPLLAAALLAGLGPYDARSLSALAVTAIWRGDAQSPDHRYRLDRLVAAGRLVDPARVAKELLDGGRTHLLTESSAAIRWLAAATELTTDPELRAEATFLLATGSVFAGDLAGAAKHARVALTRDVAEHEPGPRLELTITELLGLLGTVGPDAVRAFADQGWRSAPGDQVVARGAALFLTGRFAEAHDLLAAHRAEWLTAGSASATMGIVNSAAAALLGRWPDFERDRATAAQLPLWQEKRHRARVLGAWTWVLLLFGEPPQTPAESGAPAHPLNRTLHATLTGRWDEALDVGRRALAGPTASPFVSARISVHQHLAVILTARGLPNRARKLLAAAREQPPCLSHLLAGPEADAARLLGDPGQARRALTAGIEEATQRQLVVGVDELRLRLIELDLTADDTDAARRGLRELRRDAELAATTRARRNLLLGKVAVLRDATAATEAVRLARERAQPPELAETLAAVCRYGLGSRDLLLEAYDLFGDLGALVPRSMLRTLMRQQGVTVPGRQATVLENERLLARLVAEGLTNREVAALLGATEKSVEGRLGRYFQRTGFQSRAELANAVLTGEHPG